VDLRCSKDSTGASSELLLSHDTVTALFIEIHLELSKASSGRRVGILFQIPEKRLQVPT
jgi:hypothetical protein